MAVAGRGCVGDSQGVAGEAVYSRHRVVVVLERIGGGDWDHCGFIYH